MKSLVCLGALLIGLVAPAAMAKPVTSAAWHVAGTTPVGAYPTDLAFDADGHAWVANFGAGTVTELASDGHVLASFPAGPKPRKLAVAPDGSLWVANWGVNTLTHLSAAGQVLGRFPVGELPNSLAIAPDGAVWVGNMGSKSVMRLSADGSVEGTYAIERPSSLAVDPTGAVWVTSLTASRNNLVKLSAECQPLAAYSIGAMPERVAIDARGNVWVTHMVGPSSRKLTRLAADAARPGLLWTGFKNQAVAVDGEGDAWVANTEYVIDGENGYMIANPLTNTVTRVSPGGSILGTYSAGADAWAVKLAPWGEAWVVNHLGGSVTRLSR